MRGTADGTVVVTRHAGNGFDVVLDVTGEVMLLFGRCGDFVKAAIHFGHRTTGRFEYAGNGGNGGLTAVQVAHPGFDAAAYRDRLCIESSGNGVDFAG